MLLSAVRARGRLRLCCITAGLLLAPAMAQAGNALNLIGFGSESLGMAGADIALSRDTAAININPAGLTQIAGSRLDAYLVPFWLYGVEHSDSLNDDYNVDNPYGALLGGGYARRSSSVPGLVYGLGLYASGGTGFAYEKLTTVFGTRDEYSAVLGVTKLVGAVGYALSDRLRIGANLGLSYSQGRQKLFPDTSSNAGAQPFYGLRFDSADGTSFNTRIGLQYQALPTLKLALTYSNKTPLPLNDGTLTINYEADPDPTLGRVKYRKASIDGFALAQDLGVGAAWQVAPRWLLAAEVTWLDWSSALDSATLRASQPENPRAPAIVRLKQELDFRDQVVVAVGVEHQWTEATALRLGLNVARNPVEGNTLTPVLNVTEEKEIDFGFTHRLDSAWEVSSAMQFQLHNTTRYANPNVPVATPTREEYGLLALTLQLTRRW